MRSDRWAGRVESGRPSSPELRVSGADKADDSSRQLVRGRRLSARWLGDLAADLSDRDRAVLDALRTVRVLSGGQLERLLFAELGDGARGRIRRRVLGRLVKLGLVETLKRRIGGVRAGSAGLVYCLSAAGHRLLDLEAGISGPRRRAPHTPGRLFLLHALAISEVYVSLIEATRNRPQSGLVRFAVEGEARFEVGGDVVLRPDALVVLAAGDVEDVWWLEIDRSTESLPRLRGALERYLAFAGLGIPGPGGVVPRVLISVTSQERLRAADSLVRRLSPPADVLFVVSREEEVAERMIGELLGEIRAPPR